MGDDNTLLKFDISNENAEVLCTLDEEATCFDTMTVSKGQNEILVVGFSNGEMKILNKFGKVEKSFEAHKGSVTCIKLSHDGQTIASCGEEGTVKVEDNLTRFGLKAANCELSSSSSSNLLIASIGIRTTIILFVVPER